MQVANKTFFSLQSDSNVTYIGSNKVSNERTSESGAPSRPSGWRAPGAPGDRGPQAWRRKRGQVLFPTEEGKGGVGSLSTASVPAAPLLLALPRRLLEARTCSQGSALPSHSHRCLPFLFALRLSFSQCYLLDHWVPNATPRASRSVTQTAFLPPLSLAHLPLRTEKKKSTMLPTPLHGAPSCGSGMGPGRGGAAGGRVAWRGASQQAGG